MFGAVAILFLLFHAAGRAEVASGFLDFVPCASDRAGNGSFRGYITVGGYVTGNLLISVIAGVVAGVTLFAVGVPYAVPIAIVVAIWTSSPWSAPQSRPLSPEPLL